MPSTLPARYDLRRGIRRWLAFWNLVLGDCTIAAYLHIRMVQNVAAASTWKRLLYRIGFKVPDNALALSEYRDFLATLGETPSPTTGVDPSLFLAWEQKNGRITEWQQLTATDEDSLHAAMIAWTGVLLAIELTSRVYNHPKGEWRLQAGDKPNPNLSHAVALVAYNATDDAVVTWGYMKSMSQQFTQSTIIGAWVFK